MVMNASGTTQSEPRKTVFRVENEASVSNTCAIYNLSKKRKFLKDKFETFHPLYNPGYNLSKLSQHPSFEKNFAAFSFCITLHS